ncbi:competence type IV pilus minor pilin ComGF [Fervidibacillus albus]|uniref:Competence type IV pilus minor pilin ComGF n=1 Tax=Fervidibacillus albus TaxID=2980026 RepID=A0A9E8LVG1_9BACI|nr:competence type IV pilus minor pilin ComGF [Fervidibacillus albus]WAA10435.1 competence type IV pilus minor pilin ComGF [Fervidibacillus albus]
MFVERLKNKDGYTFFELSFVLLIFSIILVFIAHTVPLISYYDYKEESLDEMEWEVFLNQAKKELRNSEEIRLTYNRIVLFDQGDMIFYEKYGNLLRKRVNGKGHEVLLFHISSFSFERSNQGITIRITRIGGDVNEAFIFIPPHIPVEGGSS